MKLTIKTPGSLVLSLLNLFLCILGLSLGFPGLSPDWAGVMIWVVLPPLLLFTIAYFVLDLLKPVTRKQAIVAAILSVPVALVVWHLRFRGI